MTNILVTGGTGFLGSHLVKDLVSKGNTVVVIRRDNRPNKWLDVALKGAIVIEGDILDTVLVQRILADYGIQEVYHLAAQAILKTIVKDPLTAFNCNLMGCVSVLEAVRRTNPNIRVLVQTTDKVYDWSKMFVTEEDPLGSINGIYEASKVCEDTAARAYQHIYGLNIRISRPSNIYGYDLSDRIVPNTVRDCIRGKQPVIFEGQESMIRNYLYVEDYVSGVETVMANDGIFNIGTDDVYTQEEVVKRIAAKFDLEPVYKPNPNRIKELQQQAVCWDKLKALGWKPLYSFERGLKETIEKYLKYGF
jgi:CDP-glucose 4,6-dehydratase